MRIFRLRTSTVAILLLSFTLIVNLLVLQIPHFDLAKAILSFSWLILMPGWLITRLIRLRTTSSWERLAYSVGLGLLAVMLTALVTNTLLPLVGDTQPLDTPGLLLGFDIVWAGLIAAEAYRNRRRPVTISLPALNVPGLGFVITGLPTIILAILGAITLNNYGSNILTVIMLGYSAAYLSLMLYVRERIPEAALLTGLYQVALALLLMTSLRGWYTTGHDIQREYHVFILALSNLHWSVSSLRDAYNACLSITILPTVFRQILGINEVYVYKTLFQAIFAVVPVLVYLISRRHLGRLVSLVGAIYFLAFPTYFGDMPFLNRQEIAFVFVGLILLTLFSTSWTLVKRRWVVGLLGVGVVLSHYSTTYTMIALFLVVLILRLVLKLLAIHIHRPRLRRLLGLSRWRNYRVAPVTLALVVGLLGVSYVWSTQLTSTGNNISRVVTETLQGIKNGIGSDSKSSDTSYSLFGKPKLTDQQRLNAFIASVVPATRAAEAPTQLYPPSSYVNLHPKIAPDNALPLSSVGSYLNAHGVPVAKLNQLIRTGSALFLQLMLGLGILILFVGRPFRSQLDNEYRLFQLAGIVFVAAIIILPALSAEYGLLRAFQQILFVGGAAIAAASLALVPKRLKRTGQLVASLLVLGFFISSTGLLTTLLGGYGAQLHLANSGKYYDLYYPHDGEQAAIAWVTNLTTVPSSVVTIASSLGSDHYTLGSVSQFSALDVHDDIFPGTIPLDSYVFIGYTTLHQGTATVIYNGDPLTYIYPIDFLNTNKDLLYSNGHASIYR